MKGMRMLFAKLRSLLAVFLLSLSLCLTAGAPIAGAEPPPEGARTAAQAVIGAQIEAFLREDGEAAFSYASPVIREKFRTPENFMRMVRNGYSPVYAPQSYEFGESRLQGGEIVQEVILLAPDGSATLAIYKLERLPGGSWKINAVYLKDLPDQMT
jgi:hypothetical protein